MSEQKPKIFLSYAHVDLGYAKKIYDDLKRYGLEIWFDKESLLAGQRWEDKIREAIKESDFFIVLLSKEVISKGSFVYSELRFSFEIIDGYWASSKEFIIPVRLDDCKPSDADKRLAKLHWIDVFPESEYQNGLKKILQVVSPGTFLLRSEPMELSAVDVNEMIVRHGFYDGNKNPGGKGFSHKYKLKEINGDKVVFDENSCLMWQQGGSSQEMKFDDAKRYIDEINEKRFAGFNDWRFPTLEEAMSLMETEEKNDLYIDPIFDSKQRWIWTADQVKGESWAWVVGFLLGRCYCRHFYSKHCVRAVRSGQSSQE